MNELALFAGAGGGILGGKLLGWRTVCAVERDAYAAQVLAQRQNDGILEPFPIWSDVCSFDGKPWRGIVDVVSGGFPCQDISAAGKGAGITGARSGLWKEFARIIGEVRPRYAFIENSPMLTIRGLETVLCDLAAMGFDAEWGVISAENAGAPQGRERIWIVADARGKIGAQGMGCAVRVKNSGRRNGSQEWSGYRLKPTLGAEIVGRIFPWFPLESGMARMVDGVAHRTDRTVAIGNGQVPIVAATAFRILSERSRFN